MTIASITNDILGPVLMGILGLFIKPIELTANEKKNHRHDQEDKHTEHRKYSYIRNHHYLAIIVDIALYVLRQ
jgi:hypothetical protein